MEQLWFLIFGACSLIIGTNGLPPAPFVTPTQRWRTTTYGWTTQQYERTTRPYGWTTQQYEWTTRPYEWTTQPYEWTSRPYEWTTSSEVWQTNDLRGWMFSVMSGASVRFRSAHHSNMTGLTVCLRAMTEHKLWTQDQLRLTFGSDYDYVSMGGYYSDSYVLQVKGNSVTFAAYSMVPVRDVKSLWNSRCFTWDSGTGMAQLWFDGKISLRKGVSRGAVLSGPIEVSMSQFMGQISDLYIWDSVLDAKHLYNYLYRNYVCRRGLVLDWRRAEYNTRGYVVMEHTYPKWLLSGSPKPGKRGMKKLQKKRQRNLS